MSADLVGQGCRPTLTCRSVGVARSSFYRYLKSPVSSIRKRRPSPRNRLCDQERRTILSTLHEERFLDLTPREVVSVLADEGLYLGSIRTFYRVLSENAENCERRLQARRVKREAPVLEAAGPNQVWSWDITRLKGPWKRKFYFLYVMIDIFSRYVVGWMLAERENAFRAQHFIRQTLFKHLGSRGDITIHSDRGSPMISGGTRELMELLGVSQSFSRPRTSDDNPYSESQFRTLKYHHTFPSFFESKEEAEAFLSVGTSKPATNGHFLRPKTRHF
jgi:putative transposase